MKEGKTGSDLVRNITEGGFKGKVYPISHTGDQIFGLNIKKDFKDLDSLSIYSFYFREIR